MELTLHHYAFLTSNTSGWLEENELLIGIPYKIHQTIVIHSQKVSITFIEQKRGDVLIELVEPWQDNKTLQKMILKGIGFYHRGYIIGKDLFDSMLKTFEDKGGHVLPFFYSEAFDGLRCAFIVTANMGLIEIIEQ